MTAKVMLTCIALLAVLSSGCGMLAKASGGRPDVLWHEGEDYVKAPDGLEKTVDSKPPASGGKALYGSALDKKDLAATYEIKLPAPIPKARVLLRYARLHWRDSMVPARMELTLSKGDEVVTKE